MVHLFVLSCDFVACAFACVRMSDCCACRGKKLNMKENIEYITRDYAVNGALHLHIQRDAKS